MRTKCHAIVLDSALNSYATVYRSIYQLFLVAAMRTHVCIHSLKNFNISRNSLYVVRCIVEAVLFGARLIHSRTKRKPPRQLELEEVFRADISDSYRKSLSADNIVVSLENTGTCAVEHRLAVWLGFLAFHATFCCRRGEYHDILKALRGKMLVLESVLKTRASRELLIGCDDILQSNCSWL